jgi:hypothetical protein
MVFVPGTPYVTIQSLDVRDSAGGGIIVDGFATSGIWPCTNQTACQDYPIVQYNNVDHTAYTGLLDQASNYAIFRGNTVSYTGLSRVDSQSGGADGGGIYLAHCDPCHILVEANDFTNIWNETIGIGAVSTAVFRGNTISNGERVGFYTDGAADILAEQNISAGGRYTWETGLGDPSKAGGNGGPIFCTYCTVKEPSSTTIGNVANASLRIVFRNNLAAGTNRGCLYIGIDPDNVAPASGGFWGNTCIGASGMNGIVMDGSAGGVSSSNIEFKNNILATTTGVTLCQANFTTSKVIIFPNFWTGTPASSQCKGAGDLYSTFTGAGGLNLSSSFAHFADANRANFPLASDFQPSGSSGVLNAGVDLSATYLTIGDWQWEYDNMLWQPSCAAAKPSAANWAKKLATNYCNVVWDSTPNIGAL